MSEDRMMEVASQVIQKKDPFLLLLYLTSLDKDEISYLMDCMGNPQDFYVGVISFCYEYLKNKGVVLDVLYPKKTYGTYVETVFADGKDIKVSSSRRK